MEGEAIRRSADVALQDRLATPPTVEDAVIAVVFARVEVADGGDDVADATDLPESRGSRCEPRLSRRGSPVVPAVVAVSGGDERRVVLATPHVPLGDARSALGWRHPQLRSYHSELRSPHP